MSSSSKRGRDNTVAVETATRATKRQSRTAASTSTPQKSFVVEEATMGYVDVSDDELTWFLTVDEHMFLGWFPFVDDDFVEQGETVWGDDDDLWQIMSIHHIPTTQ
ncbi:hypothetical protein QJS04_geneDACA017649 [Acorus gramineus]|uniref:Uncharacterized protein n=1 Tax=Acorus gramineus TaxID=55184 RepID=A0AAV9B0B2_ACOGR|nr:hypothetical protein QJS04_geneDACA017649 [Acorus gramineus]